MPLQPLHLIALCAVLAITRPSLDTFHARDWDTGILHSAAIWISPKAFIDFFLFTFVFVAATNDVFVGVLGLWLRVPTPIVTMCSKAVAFLDRFFPQCLWGCEHGVCVARDTCLCFPGFTGFLCNQYQPSKYIYLSDVIEERWATWMKTGLCSSETLFHVLIALPILLQLACFVSVSANRFLARHVALQSDKLHTLVTGAFLNVDRAEQLLSCFPSFVQCAMLLKNVYGADNVTALILWCAVYSSVGYFVMQRRQGYQGHDSGGGGLVGVAAGLRIVVAILALQKQDWVYLRTWLADIWETTRMLDWMHMDLLFMDFLSLVDQNLVLILFREASLISWILFDLQFVWFADAKDMGSIAGGVFGGGMYAIAVQQLPSVIRFLGQIS
ncbi:hypothetical protein BJ741DRAFT_595040 [Chytriomyces cf. hyalinus JEL632]|nr:hypothetical protein BJ741DRAFT_595040 [Chytriomyces cf. hyalinus JEL632]